MVSSPKRYLCHKKNSNLSTINDFHTYQIELTFSNQYKNLINCMYVLFPAINIYCIRFEFFLSCEFNQLETCFLSLFYLVSMLDYITDLHQQNSNLHDSLLSIFRK